MAEREIIPVPKTFAELVQAVRAALITGQSHADQVYLETYRNTGHFIDAHLLYNQKRAAYGAGVVSKLARIVKVDERLLYRCLRFVREYPILARGPELSWSHYRVLLDVSDLKQRNALEVAARKNHWPAPELERRVRAVNAIDVTPTARENGATAAPERKPLVPQRGTPGVYRMIKMDGALVVDLGFACYFDLSDEQAKDVKEGDLVKLSSTGQVTVAEGATKADLFTYRVELIKVVDGDTLWVRVYLRPRQWVKQKLRLRGLDCPELSTPEGKAAKKFVDALMAKTTAIVINTTKPDKYDRYLADVFLTSAVSGKLEAESSEVFLNNTLLENGQAVRKEAWEFGDWEPDLVR